MRDKIEGSDLRTSYGHVHRHRVKKGENNQVILNQLYKYTQMQDSDQYAGHPFWAKVLT